MVNVLLMGENFNLPTPIALTVSLTSIPEIKVSGVVPSMSSSLISSKESLLRENNGNNCMVEFRELIFLTSIPSVSLTSIIKLSGATS